MFYGTKWFYKVLYFITAMSPAYFLFLLQIDDKYKHPFKMKWNIKIATIDLNIYWWCGLLFIILMLFILILRILLIKQYTASSTNQVLPSNRKTFEEDELEERNGSVISFLLGNILPAVLVIEGNLCVAIIIFIIIQMLIYVLIMKSTDIFPNIALIILGINLCKTKDNKFVFTFKSKKFEDFKVYQLGNPEKSKVYITMYEK
ncbi:antibiotic resistance protein VanZ [Bacillus tropicus]|uniref:antibiotic resistance protein VanZ n=1 Tax=Bacillus tropicus TaxID=2026188 RepID=UPI0026CE7A9E|nr:antibiotic resistance protein VanZ [Bacillus tropicus]